MKFKKGDKVKILRAAKTEEQGWDNSWWSDMDIGIGKIFTVESHNIKTKNVRFKEIAYGYPDFVLELVENTTKQTNPKDALGIKKVGLHCVPMQPLLETGLAMTEGARKYGAHNYRKDGVRFSVYFDAALRHILSWWEGEDIDPDSNVHHVIKAIACLFVVRDSMLMNNCVDDRPIRYPKSLEIEKLNEIAADLIKKYPNCKKPFTEK